MNDSALGRVFPQGKTHDTLLGLLDREGEIDRLAARHPCRRWVCAGRGDGTGADWESGAVGPLLRREGRLVIFLGQSYARW